MATPNTPEQWNWLIRCCLRLRPVEPDARDGQRPIRTVDDVDLWSAPQSFHDWASEREPALRLAATTGRHDREPRWHLSRAWEHAQLLLLRDPPSLRHEAFANSVLTALVLVARRSQDDPASLGIVLDDESRELLDRWSASDRPVVLRRWAPNRNQLALFALAA